MPCAPAPPGSNSAPKVRLHRDPDLGRRADRGVGDAVERRRAVDAGVLRRRKRERAAHAEADRADARAAGRAQVVRGRGHLLDGGLEVEVAHQVRRLLGVDADLAFVEVGHEHPEAAVAAEHQRLVLDDVGDAPPLRMRVCVVCVLCVVFVVCVQGLKECRGRARANRRQACAEHKVGPERGKGTWAHHSCSTMTAGAALSPAS